MPSEPRFEPIRIEPLDLPAVAAALCCRFGEPYAEARRLTSLHELLDTSRTLARALDDFVKTGGEHYKGVHCASDMQPDVDRLTRALTQWSESVCAASVTYRAWQRGVHVGVYSPPDDEAVRLHSTPRLADVSSIPFQSPTA